MKLKDCIKMDAAERANVASGDDAVQRVYETMKSSNRQSIAVLDGEKFLGVVDYDSILNAVMLSPKNFPALTAQDVLKVNAKHLNEDSGLEDVVTGFQEAGTRALPYFQGETFVRLVSQADLLEALTKVLEGDQSIFEDAEAKGELFMANPVVQRIMATLSDIGI